MKKDFFFVIGGGVLQVPLLNELKKQNLRSIVTDLNPNCACSKIADKFFKIDIFDVDSHIKLVDELIEQDINIVGVLAAGIDAPITMTRIAEHLQLPTVSSDIANIVHNKDLFRNKMKSLGYPTPRNTVLNEKNRENWEEIINSFGFPLIIKNTDSSGSRGTRIFKYPNLSGVLEVIIEAMSVSRSSIVLIEEVWEGEEFTVEAIFDINGKFHPMSITDRLFDKSSGYPIETGLRHPTHLSKKNQNEFFNLAEQFAIDLGIKIGVVKYDIILTELGPRIIEMTVRLSGGFDSQYLVPLATGKNLLLAAILTSMGKNIPEEILINKLNKIGVTGSVWPLPGKIKSINGINEAKKVKGITNIFLRYNEGEIIDAYQDCTKRAGFIISIADNEKEAIKQLNEASNLIQFDIERIEEYENNILRINERSQSDNKKLNSYNYQHDFTDSVEEFKNIVVKKPWGYEYLFYENKDVAIWILFLEASNSTSMHCHPAKRTSLIVLSGEVKCNTLDSEFKREHGNAIVFGRGVFHQTTALSSDGAFVMEIESPIDKTDLLRYKDNYGRENQGYESSNYYSTNLSEFKNFYQINENIDFDFYNTAFEYKKYSTYEEFLLKNNLSDADLFVLLNRGVWDNRGNLLFEVGETIQWKAVKGNPTIKVKNDLEVLLIRRRK